MVDKTIGNLTGIVRPLATDLYEAESVSEGSVKIDHQTLLDGPMLPATFQALGYTIANIAEVEAATKAMRATMRPEDIAFGNDTAFAISRHMIGAQCEISAGAGATIPASPAVAPAGSTILAAVWPFNGLAFLRKCTVSVVTSAISGTRTGVIQCFLRKNLPAINTIAVTSDILPPIGPTAGLGFGAMAPSSNYNTLSILQPPPLMVISASSAAVGISSSGIESSKDLGTAVGGAKSAIGTNIPPTTIFDCMGGGYEPYVMLGNTGFNISLNAPSAVTSQTISVSVNLQWDEWIPIPMDR